jgi:hypothetical protein
MKNRAEIHALFDVACAHGAALAWDDECAAKRVVLWPTNDYVS